MKKNNHSFLKSTLIICTKDRPNDLKECLDSVLEQTECPEEIIIIDSSNNQETELMLKNHPIKNINKIKFIYEHTKIQSSTYQRNKGVEYATGDIIHFLDDDVILEADYFEKINDVYRNDLNKEIGGVGGLILQTKRLSGTTLLADLFKKIFLLTNDNGAGKMLPSGWGTVQYRRKINTVVRTEILQGCCSYRKEVFDEYKFDENLKGAAIREDLDFSYRVSRKYKLCYTPFAKLFHKASPAGREPEELYYQKYVFNHYYLFRKNLRPTIFNILCFIWSDIGSILGIIFISIKKQSLKPLIGMIRGYIIIFKDVGYTIKKKLKLFILRLVSNFVYYFFIKTQLYKPKGIIALCYHNISEENNNDIYSISKEQFEKQMVYLLEKGYTIISLGQLLDYFQFNKQLPPKSVLLTFDDGYKSFPRIILPILKKYNYPAILFISLNFPEEGDNFMSENEIKNVSKESLVEIGAHGLSHQNLTKIPFQIVREEIVKSKEVLEKLAGLSIRVFAYPFGAYNKEIIRTVQEAGFKLAFTTRYGFIFKKSDLFTLRRIPIFSYDNINEFNKKIGGAYNWRGLW